jgi:hypothetical protein
MPTYDVACFRDQGLDVIVVVVDAAVGRMKSSDQSAAWAQMQIWASDAGLDGTVVLLWRAAPGRVGYLDPHHRNRFLNDVTPAVLARITNIQLTCGESPPREHAWATTASGTIPARRPKTLVVPAER